MDLSVRCSVAPSIITGAILPPPMKASLLLSQNRSSRRQKPRSWLGGDIILKVPPQSCLKTVSDQFVSIKVLVEPWRTLMPLKATSVRLDDETLKRVGDIAEAMDRPRAWLMAHAISSMWDVKRGSLERWRRGLSPLMKAAK